VVRVSENVHLFCENNALFALSGDGRYRYQSERARATRSAPPDTYMAGCGARASRTLPSAGITNNWVRCAAMHRHRYYGESSVASRVFLQSVGIFF
jgi:hypothetical protein